MASPAAVAAPALAAGNPQWLWFLSRGSGLVLLVLFTAVVVLGVATRTGRAGRRWPLFASAELHRTLSLFSVGLLVLHVVTAVADPYVRIGWAATVIPLLSPYRTVAIGLGALAVDLGGAVLLTSVLRHRIGLRAWRAVHWLAYLAWPAAFWHALRAGGDMHVPWVAALTWGSAVAVVVAVVVRLALRPQPAPPSPPAASAPFGSPPDSVPPAGSDSSSAFTAAGTRASSGIRAWRSPTARPGGHWLRGARQ